MSLTLTADQALDSMPFAKEIGMEFMEVNAEETTARLTWAPELCTIGNALHGGVIMAAADACGAIAAFLNLPEGATGTTTISSSTNMLRAVRKGHIETTSTVLHAGRSTVVVETVVTDSDGRTVAKVTQTQAVLR